MTEGKAAIWARVSSNRPGADDQEVRLSDWAGKRGLPVAQVYRIDESASRAEHYRTLARLYEDARLGSFRALLVWDLDGLSQDGSVALPEIEQHLWGYGVRVLSYQGEVAKTGGPPNY